MPRLLAAGGAGNAWFCALLAAPLVDSNFRTFNNPSSPPMAIYPWLLFHAIQLMRVLFGMAI